MPAQTLLPIKELDAFKSFFGQDLTTLCCTPSDWVAGLQTKSPAFEAGEQSVLVGVKRGSRMGPIQPVGVGRSGWLNRPSSIDDSSRLAGAGLSGGAYAAPQIPGQTISALEVGAGVSQLLGAIGGGVENNKMLEMMIALLIIMSLLDQQRSGGGAADALSKLGELGSQFSSSNISYSSTVVSTQHTSISYTQLNVNQVNQSHQAGGANPPKIDMTA
jgi:hypothetical protein